MDLIHKLAKDIKRTFNLKFKYELYEHNILNSIEIITDAYKDEIKNIIDSYNIASNLKDNKYRWLAIVYKSVMLNRLVFNEPILLIDEEKSDNFKLIQKEIFDWYEFKSESNEILSVFNMALCKPKKNKKNNYFVLTRNIEASSDENSVDITSVFPDKFINHYRDCLEKTIIEYKDKESKGSKLFKRISEIIDIACKSILSTSYGQTEIRKIQFKLAKIIGNMKIARASSYSILATLFCLTVVDPKWKYYYYLPYSSYSSNPYGSIAIATEKECNIKLLDEEPPEFLLSDLFYTLNFIEDHLKKKLEEEVKKWDNQRINYQKASDKNIIIQDLHELYLVTKNLYVSLNYINNTKNVPSVVLENEGGEILLSIYRDNPIIKPSEIKDIVLDIEDRLEHVSDVLQIPKSFSSKSLSLNGWLDVDIISSSKIFSKLSSESIIGVTDLSNV